MPPISQPSSLVMHAMLDKHCKDSKSSSPLDDLIIVSNRVSAAILSWVRSCTLRSPMESMEGGLRALGHPGRKISGETEGKEVEPKCRGGVHKRCAGSGEKGGV